MWMVGGQDTNIAAAVQRFITNPVHTSTLSTLQHCPHCNAVQHCPHFNGHWKIRASFNPNLGSGTSPKSTFKLESLCLISRLWHWRVNFPASPLHLSTPSISWCSEYFLMHRLSPATRGPVVRGNTRHRFSMYPHQPPPCQYAFLWKRIPRLKVLS